MSWGFVRSEHAAMLQASGITEDHAYARKYRSVEEKARLEHVGVTRTGRRVPGLLVPQLRADGSCWGYQYRPNEPRLRDGKPVKYETPTGQRNGIDVPPGVGPKLDDPTIPLWITEGVKKADAAAVAGLCCVALPGVWSWRGRNERGGKVAVPDWHDIALNERRVILAFDGDVARKRSVRAALDTLADYLRSKGALVEFCHLPDEDDKVGLDDYLMAGHTAGDLVSRIHPEPPEVVDRQVTPVTDEPSSTSGGSDASGGSGGSGGDTLHRGIELSGEVREDGSALLDEVRAWLARHITVMKPTDLDVLTVWAAHTHLSRRLYSTPRLQVDSPVPESGKTTVLEHLERLCFRPVIASTISSPALLPRMLAVEPRTLLLDEVDRSLDPKKDGVGELLAILNSGYKVGASRPTLVPVKEGGWEPKELPTFAPVVMAGNQPNLPDDTRTRIIRVLLLPDWSGRAEESDWETKETEAATLGARLARWATHVEDEVRPRPEMPAGCTSRFREKWQPLARVAQAAGPRWLEVMMQCAADDVAEVHADREAGLAAEKPGVLLLRHLMTCWPTGAEFWRTTDLVETLILEHPEVWGDSSPYGRALTAQRLGRMLVSNYRIRSTVQDTADKNSPRGYRRDQFAGAHGAMAARSAEASGPAESSSHGTTIHTPTGYHSGGSAPAVVPSLPEPPERPELPEPPESDRPTRWHVPPGPGRCPACGFHTVKQGHRDECPRREAS